jgi:hypothetical protein
MKKIYITLLAIAAIGASQVVLAEPVVQGKRACEEHNNCVNGTTKGDVCNKHQSSKDTCCLNIDEPIVSTVVDTLPRVVVI